MSNAQQSDMVWTLDFDQNKNENLSLNGQTDTWLCSGVHVSTPSSRNID